MDYSDTSLSRGPEAKREHNVIKNSIIELTNKKVPVCAIKFLEGGTARICGGIVVGGDIFCMKVAEDCTTAPHTRFKGFSEELSRDIEGAWVIMAQPEQHLPESDFFQTSLGASTA